MNAIGGSAIIDFRQGMKFFRHASFNDFNHDAGKKPERWAIVTYGAVARRGILRW
jgi:hypothetical protein